jgi:hypothetical protein
MAELMLVNPRRKRRGAKRRRKMTAKQLLYFGKGRKRRRSRVAAAATPRRRHRRRSSVVAAAPHRRRSRRRHVTRLRRNPLRMGNFSIKRFMNDALMPAGVGAVGALGVDLALGYGGHYLPASLQTGLPNTLVRLAGAVGVGYVAGMAAGKKFGEAATAGAITVTLYDLIKGYVKGAMPSLPLSGMGWVSPGLQVGGGYGGMNAYVGADHAYSGMGAYVGIGESESSYYGGYDN